MRSRWTNEMTDTNYKKATILENNKGIAHFPNESNLFIFNFLSFHS